MKSQRRVRPVEAAAVSAALVVAGLSWARSMPTEGVVLALGVIALAALLLAARGYLAGHRKIRRSQKAANRRQR